MIIIPATILNSIVLQYLWEWFVTPVFNIGALSFKYALGFSIFYSFLSYTPQTWKDDRSEDEKLQSIVLIYVYPLICLLIGYLIHIYL